MKKSLLLSGFIALGLMASAQTPYAYGLQSELTNKTLRATFNVAGSTASGIEVGVYDGDELVKSAEVEDLTAGLKEVEIDLTGLDESKTYTWSVSVGAPAVTAPTVFPQVYTFWSPYGIAIDKNTNSDHFGRILVTECQPSVHGKTAYWTSDVSEGVGVGIYAFDPNMNRIANEDGKYGFNGGKTFVNYSYADEGGSGNNFGLKKIRLSEDGRLFVGSLDSRDGEPLYEVNPDNLNEWTPVFQGTTNHAIGDGTVVDADGNFIAGPSAAFDVIGSGDDLKIVNLSCKGGCVFAYGRYQMYEYPLGSAKTWSAAAAAEDEIVPLSMQYTISSQSVSIAYDPEGGVWYSQYRGAPSEAQPAFKHAFKNVDGEWEENYSDIETIARGGGVAFSRDGILALPIANFTVALYQVDDDADGNPVLTELTRITNNENSKVRGFNDIAFDYAGNLYGCDNGLETFTGFQLPQAAKAGVIRRALGSDPVVTTPAPEKFAINLSVTGVDAIANSNINVRAGYGYLAVEGANKVEVYNLNGQKLSNQNKVEVPAGIYVVVADGKAMKVRVK